MLGGKMFKKKVSQEEFDKLEQKQLKLENRLRSLCELLCVAFTLDAFDEGVAIYTQKDR
jgi:hypothetical protein